MVTVTGPHIVTFAGLAELFLCVLTDGFQQPVAGAVPSVFGHRERLVDQQRDLVQHLVSLQLAADDSAGSVEIEAAEEHRQPAEQQLFRLD